MSLSRKLIERLIEKEVSSNESIDTEHKEKVSKLAQQIFLIQITQPDDREKRKNMLDKIEHFYSIMSEGDIK
ncbi:hypothetical protein P3551_22270 [Vibrio parahaemolyticus]|uniref:hypothetical protein n=1 Tax=Vibrio TaxID=662 RepID=UPI0010239CAA|nr:MULTISPECIES: hypothetical protein [Vibrio]EIT7126853.1 hypothetical protein [Vibrio parahaemolyticus]EIT7131839.1 hypothetical protein [Vibrio parahaemolyticus]EIZ1368701.1 hypothetical protein [Vibrio parahaemolyticus]EIZ4252289.1 hypothetical protein [Vibrio parahaemolyticus]ELP6737139.1 hypothetical protein [Vibrio vulnificus]